MANPARYTLSVDAEAKRIFKTLRRKNPDVYREVKASAVKLLRNPELGKPLRHGLRNCRRLHIASSFVLVYEITAMEVRLLDFDHHNKIYKKYRGG